MKKNNFKLSLVIGLAVLGSLVIQDNILAMEDNEEKNRSSYKLKIEIDFSRDKDILDKDILTKTQRKTFEEASQFWQNYLLSALPDQEHKVKIFADANFSDDVGRILGRASPTHVYKGTNAVAEGEMTFDRVDIDILEKNGTLKNVIIHEMGHVLGFGTMWESLGVISFKDTYNPVFTGPKAKKIYGDLISNLPTDVPVENCGGPGTYGSHWRESIFGIELMTGYISSSSDFISSLTVAAFEDIGYKTNYLNVKKYTIPSKELLRKVAEKPHAYGVRKVLNNGKKTLEEFLTIPLN